ncbi:MAG: sigma-54 dependent transcriptional regulator [Opitutales bacterium]|nr:sigma-54 dependent transcriptional regulator [Opitutales bacterium]
MPAETVLILDDELIIRKTLQQYLTRKRHRVCTADTIEAARKVLFDNDASFDLMFCDVNLPDGLGTDLLEEIQHMENPPVVVMITGQGTIESAVRSMKLGAFDYLLKPFSHDEINIILGKANKYQRLIQVNQGLSSAISSSESRALVGESEPIQRLRGLIQNVAQTDATVLISGETGTGKELISLAIHNASQRRKQPFIKVNCAAVTETLIESEFFGHEKGAFTGAMQKRIGRFELADGGTLLLDEVSEISLPLQAKLLRVLQEREFERVGGTKTIKVDVRILATTNRNLLQAVEEGTFREDLYYRLNVFPLESPSLRERGEDVMLIAETFLKEFARKHGRRLSGLAEETKRALLCYQWPGNVRELQNVIERAVIMTVKGHFVGLESLPLEIQNHYAEQGGGRPVPESQSMLPGATNQPAVRAAGPPAESAGFDSPANDRLSRSKDLTLASVERELILECLQRCDGNRTQAAEMMGVSIRTLRNKLSQYKDENRTEFVPYF